MNWKLIIVGGLVFWVVTNILAFGVMGPIIHGSVLYPTYQAHQSFWVEPLRQDPPDEAAMMPQWILVSLLSSLVVAGIYDCVASAFRGPGWKRGMTWGLCLGIFSFVNLIGYSGIIALPMDLWVWWGIDGMVMFLIGGAALGWAGERFAGGER